jgi:hypothetical protein
MNRATLFLLGSLMLLLNCSAAHGQGCFVPHFSVYTSVARDGKNIYTSVSMQGYAYIQCSMNSGVTHKAAAQNVISNAGGWTYSGSSCPSCYYTVSGHDSFVGVPGVVYTWNWDGEAICSIRGDFFDDGGSGSIVGCLVPSTETTADAGFNGGTFREAFDMTLSDTAQDNFGGYYVQEVTTAPGTNTCYWSGSGLSQHPGVQGSQWTVGTVAGVAEPNHWGFDSIGWNLSDLDNIVQNGPRNGVTFPCVTTIHQGMQIMCNANTYWQYRADDIIITIDNDPNSEEACRDGVCPLYPMQLAYRGGRQSTWSARTLSSGDTFSVVVTAKEAK